MSDFDSGRVEVDGVVTTSPTGTQNVALVSTYVVQPVSGTFTYTPPSSSLDLFGRNRVSIPESLFSAQFLIDKAPLLWDELLVSGGTSTFVANTSSIALAVTTASGDRVVRQTKEYFAYEPDRAQQFAFTFLFGTATTNCVQRIGAFDDNDGVFIQLSGSSFSTVIRSSSSGSPVNNVISQSSFNIDKLDGTGPSGMTLDVTKVQLIFIEYQWFGVGTVRFGIFWNGQIFYFHQVHHANISTQVYMKRGSLPARYEIVNTGTLANAVTLEQICCAVQSEAGYKPTGIKRAIDTGTTAITVTSTNSRPLLSIRLKSTAIRASVIPEFFSILTDAANNYRFQIVLNGSLTGASFSSVATASVVEFDTAATAMTGGTLLSAGYISSSVRQAIGIDLASLLKIVSNISGTSDTLTLYVSNISSNVAYHGALEWKEFS
jgi:hypothetical protein